MKSLLLLIASIAVLSAATRVARSSRPMGPNSYPGAVQETDPSKMKYTNFSWIAVPEVNKDNKGENYLVPVQVLKSQEKSAGGTINTLEVLYSESTCSIDMDVSKVNEESCPLKDEGLRSIYHVEIFEKAGWRRLLEITKFKIRDVDVDEQF